MDVDIDPPDCINDPNSPDKDKFSEYPLFPEKKTIKFKHLSETQKKWARDLGMVNNKNELKNNTSRIICDLSPKRHYIVHYQYLNFAVSLGYKVKNVHKMIKFSETDFAHDFVMQCHELRKAAKKAKREAEADTFKLLLNSAYGKMCENTENRCRSKLVNNEEDFLKCSSNPYFTGFISIDGCDLRICKFKKYKCSIDKPSYIGMAILFESKRLMAKFWYEQLYRKYGKNLKLLMTDTDSFIFKIQTKDFYKDVQVDLNFQRWMDTGNLNCKFLKDKNIKYMNYNRTSDLNLMKLEENKNGLYTITKFCGLKAKMYAYEKQKVDDDEHKTVSDSRAKGVTKGFRIKTCDYDYYKDILEKEKRIPVEQYSFRSARQILYTVRQEKLAFTVFDIKRKYTDPLHSLPYKNVIKPHDDDIYHDSDLDDDDEIIN